MDRCFSFIHKPISIDVICHGRRNMFIGGFDFENQIPPSSYLLDNGSSLTKSKYLHILFNPLTVGFLINSEVKCLYVVLYLELDYLASLEN